MDIPKKQLKNGFAMPVYGLGTWQMGGRSERNPDNDDAADIRAIEIAIEQGVTHIDSAEMYAAGYAEELVGRAIKRFDRDNLFLATKVSPSHARAADVRKSAEASLKRLGVDYVDLYMLHAFTRHVLLEETMSAMSALVDDGLVRAIGVSNFGSNNLAKAQASSEHPIVVNQVHYNLAVREVEEDGLLTYCQSNDVLLMAWRPVRFNYDVPLVAELAEKYGKTQTQIALNWLISQDNVITLSKTRDPKHLEENLGSCDWLMEHADVERLRAEYPGQLKVSPDVPLD